MNAERWDEAREGWLSEAALRRKIEALGYIVSRYVFPRRTRFETHTHEVERIDAVLSGRLRVSFGARSFILAPGDYICVPAGAEHEAEVIGEENVILFDAIKVSSQTFQPRQETVLTRIRSRLRIP